MKFQFAAAAFVTLSVAACSPASDADGASLPHNMPADTSDPRNTPGYVVDSLFTMDEQLARFRSTLGAEVTTLMGGASSLDDLAAAFVTAAARADTIALRSLHLSVEEFAWLYFPHSEFARPPYELPPALLWFQTTAEGGKGITKVIRHLTNVAPGSQSLACPDEPVAQGANRIWRQCVLSWNDSDGKSHSGMLFGAVVERDGVFKITTFANKL